MQQLHGLHARSADVCSSTAPVEAEGTQVAVLHRLYKADTVHVQQLAPADSSQHHDVAGLLCPLTRVTPGSINSTRASDALGGMLPQSNCNCVTPCESFTVSYSYQVTIPRGMRTAPSDGTITGSMLSVLTVLACQVT